MTLEERIQIFDCFFDLLQSTSGRLAKEQAVTVFERTYPELKEDWVYILETLDGKHPIGWTFVARFRAIETLREPMPYMDGIHTIKKMIQLCESAHDKTFALVGEKISVRYISLDHVCITLFAGDDLVGYLMNTCPLDHNADLDRVLGTQMRKGQIGGIYFRY